MLSLATSPASVRRSLAFRPTTLHPPQEDWHSLDGQLPADDLARILLAGLNRLDWTPLWDLYAGRGSPAYPPHRLLAVAIYEIRQGHLSPAQWYRNARKVDSLRWLLAGFTPSRSCWYNFRDRIGPMLDEFNQQLLHQLDNEKLVPANCGTLDGTMISANASRHRMVNQETLRRRLELLEASDAPKPATAASSTHPSTDDSSTRTYPAVEQTQQAEETVAESSPDACQENIRVPTQADKSITGQEDTASDRGKTATESAKSPAWMAKTQVGRQRQRQGYQRAQVRMTQLQAENRQRKKDKRRPAEKLVVSLSDPESALGWDKLKVYRPLYNVQLLNDVDSPFILGYQVVAQVNDAGLMKGMLERQRQMLGRQVQKLLADSGYTGGADLAAADEAKVTVYGPWQENDYSKQKQAKKGKRVKRMDKSKFSYSKEEDAYRCPEGKNLAKVGEQAQRRETSGRVTLRMYQAKAEDCRECRRQQECTSSAKRGRTVSRSEYEELIEALKARGETQEGKELYKLRKQAGERFNADFKQHRKLRTFSGRGLRRTSGEVALMVFANNLISGESERAKKAKRLALSPDTVNPIQR